MNEIVKVLIIEDDDDEARLIQSLLSSQKIAALEEVSFQVYRENSVDNGLRFLAHNTPDIILLDLNLPDSEGTDTLIRVHNQAPSVPIVVLTGTNERNLALKVIQMGAQDYLIKGQSDLQILVRCVRYALERKRADEKLKKATTQLIYAEKMKSVGRLAAGAAHEVKNPLAILRMGVDYFSRKLPQSDEKSMVMLERMKEAISRANFVIKGLLDFASIKDLDMKEGNINQVIIEALDLVKHDFDKKQIEVEQALDKDLPTVLIDRNRLHQVFINVFMNAVEASANGGKVSVRTYAKKLDQVGPYVGLRKGDVFKIGQQVVIIEITDSGPGISAETLHHLFDPFFTTKRGSGGTGLGLSVVKNIIDEHRGMINLDNEKGMGVRVTITLRAAESPK